MKRLRVCLSLAFLLACFDGAASSPKSAPDPRTIIEKMVKVYATASSYQDSGSVVILESGLRGDPGSDIKLSQIVPSKKVAVVEFKTYFRRPRLFRFDWKNSIRAQPGVSVVWSTGKEVFSWTRDDALKNGTFVLRKGSELKTYTDDALIASGGAIYTVPSLLKEDVTHLPFSDLISNIRNPSVLREERLDNELCYVIQGDIDGVPWVLWIGKRSYLLRKTRTVYSARPLHPKEHVDKGEILIAEEVHNGIKMNARIAGRLFEYRPRIQADDVNLTQ
jgi:outer membrane lipoprotein-sorting protein